MNSYVASRIWRHGGPVSDPSGEESKNSGFAEASREEGPKNEQAVSDFPHSGSNNGGTINRLTYKESKNGGVGEDSDGGLVEESRKAELANSKPNSHLLQAPFDSDDHGAYLPLTASDNGALVGTSGQGRCDRQSTNAATGKFLPLCTLRVRVLITANQYLVMYNRYCGM